MLNSLVASLLSTVLELMTIVSFLRFYLRQTSRIEHETHALGKIMYKCVFNLNPEKCLTQIH